jgi:tetratricopeptide (TPR) repeat protein
MFIDSCSDRPSQIRAAVEAASILDTSNQAHLAPLILERIYSLNHAGLEEDDEARLLLAKSMLFYAANRLTSSMNCVNEAIATLEPRKTPNSALAMFYQGLGAIRTKQGAYRGSVSAYLRCFETAMRVGNDGIAIQACANVALSFARLGEYMTSLEWGRKALECSDKDRRGYYCLPAAISTVLSYAMLGRQQEAEAALRDATETFGTFGSSGRAQAWALHTADVYAMLGKWEQAHCEGLRATSGVNDNVHMTRYAGPYARWVARTTVRTENARAGEEKLNNLLAKLDTLDVIDRAEVVNAKTWLDAKNGSSRMDALQQMRDHLRELPSAIEDQLAQIGMLDF